MKMKVSAIFQINIISCRLCCKNMNVANRNLIIKTLVIIFILLLLGIYDNYRNGENYRLEMRKKSDWNFGGLYVKSFNDSVFYAESLSDSIYGINYRKYLPEGESLRNGDLLQIKSNHIGGDTVDVKFIHISRSRSAKIWLSVIPVFIVAFLFFKYFGFDKNIKRFRIK